MIYNNKKHEKLIKEIKNNKNYKSYKELLNEYSPLIKSLSINLKSKYKHTPIEREDIENILSENFLGLVQKYSNERGMSFSSYIKQFLIYKGINYLREYTKEKHFSMNYNTEFNEQIHIENKFISEKQTLDELNHFIKNTNLSKVEISVLNMIIEGKKSNEIANELGKTRQAVNHAKNRAINKIRKNFDITI